ncbi:MAG TPA: hypothetical protein VNK48_15540 [Xanthobacteraceae bacterium]|nr:hypothetical protein [Xanthobacteraceae bacterium]
MSVILIDAREFWFVAEKIRTSKQPASFYQALQGSSCTEQRKIILKIANTTLSRFCNLFSQECRRKPASRERVMRGLGKRHHEQDKGHTINA